MSNKRKIREFLQNALGFYLYRTPPRGTDFYSDIRVALPGFSPDVIFDVGANVGQNADEYVKRFPKSRIHAFEPVPTTADKLESRFSGNPRISVFRKAMSDHTGEIKMEFKAASATSRIGSGDSGSEVKTDTIENHCRNQSVSHVGLLKIDTEGHDLKVLHGARSMLAAQKIDMVQVEAGMSPDNGIHARFEDMKLFLEEYDYRLFGLYEQVQEFPTHRQSLRRTNPVFISRAIIEANVY